ncbi:MAG: acyl carrier protein [Acidimicrobiales bacterium]|jgi:acyl carrier protein
MKRLSTEQAMAVIKEAITTIAPDVEAELSSLDPAVDLWELFELDSMDHLNVMVEIQDQTGVDVPDREYGRLRSLASLAGYVAGA